MRNDILKILDSYPASAIKKLPQAKGELYLIGEREQTISALTALMCYREVTGMFTAFKEVHSSLNYEAVIAFILRKLRAVYGEESVVSAIEQVKNEQK